MRLHATIQAVCLTLVAQIAGAQELPPPAVVTVAQPVSQSFPEQLVYGGKVVAAQRLEVRSSVAGQVTKVLVAPGAEVQAGDVLFELDHRRYQALADQAWADQQRAVAERKFAVENHKRLSKLALLDGVSAERMLQADADRQRALAAEDRARAAFQLCELDVEATRIKAPFAGRIGTELATVGTLATPATLLATLVSTPRMEVKFEMDVNGWALTERLQRTRKVKEQRFPETVRVGLEVGDGFPLTAKTLSEDVSGTDANGLVSIRAELGDLKGEVLPGQTVFVRVEVGPQSRGILVPDSAVQHAGLETYVWVVGPMKQLQRRPVTLGPHIGELYVIRTGLDRREWVAIDPLPQHQPETKVELIFAELTAK